MIPQPSLSPRLVAFALLGVLHAGLAQGFCFQAAEERTGLPAALIEAVAKAESNLNPSAVNTSHKAKTGTVDLGLMQVNSGNLGRLGNGITRDKLLDDPCLNTLVGASILAEKVRALGYGWTAIGAYNASCTQLKGAACSNARNAYAWRVYRALKSQATSDPNSRPVEPTLRRASIATIELASLPSSVSEPNRPDAGRLTHQPTNE